ANTCSKGSRSFCSLIGAGAGGCWPLSVAFASDATSMSGSTSESITRSSDLVRSWLRSRRVVSRLPSTSSVPPARKAATRTRWKAPTSSLGRIGVSIWISYELVQAAASRSAPRLLASLACRAVIDFLEQLVVLLDHRVVRLEFERLLIRGARLGEIAF